MRKVSSCCLVLGIFPFCTGVIAAEPAIGLVAEKWGEEAETAREVARKLGVATGLPLEKARVVWCHQTTMDAAALGNHIAAGHGLLLSGSAVSLLNQLGLDTLQTKPVTFGHDRAQAGLTPVAAGHPAFRELEPDHGVIWMSNVIYPAFAEASFTKGTVLASSPGGAVVEYQLGKGRIIAVPWRLSPLYFHAARGYRENFERFLANVLDYLREPQAYAPVARPPGKPAAPPPEIPAFDILLVKRSANKLGLPTNYQGNSSLEPTGYTNEICILSGGKLTTVYRPDGGRFVGDVRLHFDAQRLLFSMPGANKRWQVFEINTDGTGLHQLPLIADPDVDNYDACYLPGGQIIFTSTAAFTGVPCVRGSAHVANLYLLETNGTIRRLTVEQDHDWCPTLLPNGRVLYLRWEYTDIPHAFSRRLFHMNPDGTEQMEFYGSNSYWPASMFYAKPVPGSATQFVAVVGGHHELPRMGDLVLFDVAKGRFEADGAVQRIPGRGRKVEPAMLDLPIAQNWPKFLHPYPLDDKHFLVSCKPSPSAQWCIYLADVNDNLILICEHPGFALLEPIPLRRTPCPPAVADKVQPNRHDAEILLTDVYAGPGLKGVPRGTVKALRVFTYHFAYQGMGGEPDAPGLDGPWDIKAVLGTVPVCEDGSARFLVPACTPISIQPLDADGQAVQLMRSWFTAMPGEVLSCVGCHERQNTAPPNHKTIAALQPAETIRRWYGPARGFDFRREVQPVLDELCISCHADLTDQPDRPMQDNKDGYNLASHFSPSYYALRRHVRTPAREGDMHLLPPYEYHAETTRLVQMLRNGHYKVTLDAEAWDRLITWIDLGAPSHGTWTDICGAARVKHQAERRREMNRRYTGMDGDPEAISNPYQPAANLAAAGKARPPAAPAVNTSPAETARPAHTVQRRSFDLGSGISLDVVLIPAEKPFWLGKCEITNEQFALFDPAHDSGVENGDYIKFSPGERGWSLARPRQPVVRVSWHATTAFCQWLTTKTGHRFRLPTETEWELACRVGTTTPFWYGTLDTDFSKFANMSDRSNQAIDPFGWSGRTLVIPPWRPADARFDDHARVSATVGSYAANPWGLHDMHGNAAEWTSTADKSGRMVVRGGSWYDTPARCQSDFRQTYRPEQGVFDVGFRVLTDSAE